jgi:uncharacterized protein YndB with AHSA1/START domain
MNSNINNQNLSETSDREIVVSRVFDAATVLVFDAWTDKDLVGHWWGPNGFTITTLEMEVKVGGVWKFIMHGPDGVDYPNQIDYLEVVKGERLVYYHGSGEENDPSLFHVTVTFDNQDGKTFLTMRSLFASVEERNKVIEFGAIEGGKQTLGRLASFLNLSK